MEILFVLVPVSILLIGAAIWAFIWAVNSGQFEDLERHGYEILFGDDEPAERDADDRKES